MEVHHIRHGVPFFCNYRDTFVKVLTDLNQYYFKTLNLKYYEVTQKIMYPMAMGAT